MAIQHRATLIAPSGSAARVNTNSETSLSTENVNLSGNESTTLNADDRFNPDDGKTGRSDEYYALQGRRAEKYGWRTTKLLTELSDVMLKSRKDFVFACGGSIPLDDKQPEEAKAVPKSKDSSSAISLTNVATPTKPQFMSIRWDSHDASMPASCTKLSFPAHSPPSMSENVAQLLSDMAPATFGLGGKDVYDEKYRKASKMEPTQFSTNFCPYTLGIVDAIAQILLPEGHQGKERGVKAELYKLNVYQGPSGRFRAHVDTPRSATQFGSLVVCLPMPHEGGQLKVRHDDEEITFDWSGAPFNIQWAAFYSDCEHEVLEVTSGHRLTLTYNLFAVPDKSQLTRPSDSALDLTQLPLYRRLKNIFDEEKFMPEGGWLGLYTAHAYAHSGSKFEVGTLKGLDMAIWQAFQHLGCEVRLRPVIELDWDASYLGDESEEREERESHFIGRNLPLETFYGTYEDLEEIHGQLEGWSEQNIKHRNVEWLNDPVSENEMQIGYAAYGNNASAEYLYSKCAILVGVPRYSENGRVRHVETIKEKEQEQ